MRARTLLALWLALAIAALPFSMAAMMQAHAAGSHGVGQFHSQHGQHGQLAGHLAGGKTSPDAGHGMTGRHSHYAHFAHCAAAQMVLPAACDNRSPFAADAAIELACLAELAGQASAPATPPPRG
jgi:hypothetical protein